MWQASALSAARVISVSSPTRCSLEAFEPGHLFRLREAYESPGQALDGETGVYTDLGAPTTHPAQGPGLTGSQPCETDAAIHPGREPAMVPQARSGRAWMDIQVSEASAHLPRGIWVSPRKLRRPLGWLHPGTLPASANYLPLRPVS